MQIQAFIGNSIVSVLMALVASLAFESPMVVVEKLLFPQPKTKSNDTNEKKPIDEHITNNTTNFNGNVRYELALNKNTCNQ